MREGEGQHERTRPWTTEADIRRGGGGALQQDDTTHGTLETRPTVGGGAWREGGGVADREIARYASVVESQFVFFFYSKI